MQSIFDLFYTWLKFSCRDCNREVFFLQIMLMYEFLAHEARYVKAPIEHAGNLVPARQ